MSHEYLEIRALGMNLGWGHRRGDRPVGSVWKKTELDITAHTLKHRLKQEWLVPSTKEAYDKYHGLDTPPPSSPPPPPPPPPEKEEPEQEEPEATEEDENDEAPEKEGEEEEPESPGPVRHGLNEDAYWEENKVSTGKAKCPDCGNMYRGKKNLIACPCQNKT